MKWFKHYSDAHNNLKLKSLVDSYGWEGYGIWWICCEICANNGKSTESWCIPMYKGWKSELLTVSKVEPRRLNRMLKKMAYLHLIDGNELKKGNLAIPQMVEYCDDYSERVRRKYGQCSDNVPLEENRIDKIRIDRDGLNKFKNLKEKVLKNNPMPNFQEVSEEFKHIGVRHEIDEKTGEIKRIPL